MRMCLGPLESANAPKWQTQFITQRKWANANSPGNWSLLSLSPSHSLSLENYGAREGVRIATPAGIAGYAPLNVLERNETCACALWMFRCHFDSCECPLTTNKDLSLQDSNSCLALAGRNAWKEERREREQEIVCSVWQQNSSVCKFVCLFFCVFAFKIIKTRVKLKIYDSK